MTLIVGLLCKDGIIIAADGAATLGNLGAYTASQKVKKLSIVEDRIVIGVSGAVGISQLLTDRIEKLYIDKGVSGTKCKTNADAMRNISEAFRIDINNALNTARIASGGQGQQASSALSSAVVALAINSRLCLIQFNHLCIPELATPDLPFISIGSGQVMADPFLAFLRRVFFPNNLPNIAEGIFYTIWTLRQAIETSPGGVSDPIQVIELKVDSVRELELSVLCEHEQNIIEAQRYMSKFTDEFRGTQDNTESPPVP